tara:strand:- start:147 stop:539 length:393 start_codon:yes stop_codon:yes gene_type:complete
MQQRIGYADAGIVNAGNLRSLPISAAGSAAVNSGVGSMVKQGLGSFIKKLPGRMTGAAGFLLDPTMLGGKYEDQEMRMINDPSLNFGYDEGQYNFNTPMFEGGLTIRDLLEEGDYSLEEILAALQEGDEY